jgi:septum formation protein
MSISTIKMILASGSPRRKELLSRLGYEFGVVAPDIDENVIDGESPEQHVMRLALAKAMAVAENNPDDLVIGADTIVVLGERILGKPTSVDDAISMLTLLSGKAHIVYTGLALVLFGEEIIKSDFDKTRVVFNPLNQTDIAGYVASGEPLDKAGAYGIQGMGSFLVKNYDGEFDTVIGFPTKLFSKIYEEVVSCRNR